MFVILYQHSSLLKCLYRSLC